MIELLATGLAASAGVLAGWGLQRAAWPTWQRCVVALVLTAMTFFIGSRLGAWAIMQSAGSGVGQQLGSFFISVLAGITWAVVGTGLFLLGLMLGWAVSKARIQSGGRAP